MIWSGNDCGQDKYPYCRYGDGFVLLVKGENVLWGKIDRLIDIGTWYGVEMNVDRTTIPTTDYDGSKKREECGIFQPFELLSAIFTREIESRISLAIAKFSKKKALFACKFELKFKK
jgi:hypothetical protein